MKSFILSILCHVKYCEFDKSTQQASNMITYGDVVPRSALHIVSVIHRSLVDSLIDGQ